MKIRNFQSKQMLKLYLLKYRTYEHNLKKNNVSCSSVDFSLNRIIMNLKKVLQVIFDYEQADKRILFIGVPKQLEIKINKLTKHVALPGDFNLQGIFSNNCDILEISKKNKRDLQDFNLKLFLPKLSKKPDLVVLFAHKKKQSIISESYFTKTSLIVINDDQSSKNMLLNNCYRVPGNENCLETIYNHNFFCICLNFLFSKFKPSVK